MTPDFLKMSPSDRARRHQQKTAVVLGFLGSGEGYSILPVVAELLQTSERNALRLLQKLVEDKLIKVDEKILTHTRQKLYGITDHGLSMVGAAKEVRAFQIGKTNPSWVQHHVDCQRARIKCEMAGWSGWVPGRILMGKNADRLKKLPDALAIRPDGRRVAIEIERFVKSTKRTCDVLGMHLQQISVGKYDLVYYITPHVEAQQRAFERVEFVPVENKKIKLNDMHRARFKVFDLTKFKGEQQ